MAQDLCSTSFIFKEKQWSIADASLREFINAGLESTDETTDTAAMKAKRRLRTREELLALEDKYFPGTLGNLLSLGAAHFRVTNRKNGRRTHGNGATRSRRRKAVAG